MEEFARIQSIFQTTHVIARQHQLGPDSTAMCRYLAKTLQIHVKTVQPAQIQLTTWITLAIVQTTRLLTQVKIVTKKFIVNTIIPVKMEDFVLMMPPIIHNLD